MALRVMSENIGVNVGTDICPNTQSADLQIVSTTDNNTTDTTDGLQSSNVALIGDCTSRKAPMSCAIFVVESLKISGETLMSQIDDLVKQGDVHRIVIKNKEGHNLLTVPTDLNTVEDSISAILSAEATAINIISAVVPYPKLVVERFA